jgi:hypothetical protein
LYVAGGTAQDVIDVGQRGGTIGWEGRSTGGSGGIIGNCGPVCDGANASGSANESEHTDNSGEGKEKNQSSSVDKHYINGILEEMKKEVSPDLYRLMKDYGFEYSEVIDKIKNEADWRPLGGSEAGRYSNWGGFVFDPVLIGNDRWLKHTVTHEIGHYFLRNSLMAFLTTGTDARTWALISDHVEADVLANDTWLTILPPIGYSFEVYQYGDIWP